MAYLTLVDGENRISFEFHGRPILRDVLAEQGYAVFSPCGGNGSCGKCRVKVFGAVSEPNEKEKALCCRLACQTVLLGDATVEISCFSEKLEHIEADISRERIKNADWEKYAAAIDIGTTTVVLKLFDASGKCIGNASDVNPQRLVASDVIGRIAAALRGKGELLQKQISECICELLARACKQANISADGVEKFVITGNTAMMYLLTNRDPESISKYPFEADALFGIWVNKNTYLAPCMNAFIGGDVTCAVLASGMCESEKTALLCDIGTNGEIALWKNGKLFVTSAAAGPAFEGAEISCGCGNILGAVDKVTVEEDRIYAHTIGDKSAVGICGTGLIDAIDAFLKLGFIDKTGYALKKLELTANGGSVTLTQDDIRAVQLAKAAIYAGINTLLERTETNIEDIKSFYIAGGFGNHISMSCASRIGLIPKSLSDIAKPIGNAALAGACDMLFDRERIEFAKHIAGNSEHIELGGSEDFYKKFIEAIDFE